ncbi:MAG TPA: exosortase A, partial [Rhodopila sp.]|nr:exosortase A [Rhodopila sp.]
MSQADTDPGAPAERLDVKPEDLAGITRSELRRLIVPMGGGLLLWGLIFHQEVAAAVHTWDASTAYNHCFLIIPIFLYLLWDRRFDLIGIRVRPTWRALPLGIPLAVAWLAAERLGIMEGRQLIAVSFAQVLFFSILGPELWKRMAGPLLYLYFLVPFGEFLTTRLQDITTEFVRYGLMVLNIPAYIDGYVIEIPQGTFLIAEACAGLRFLIASIAFGCLYAILMYRSPVRRGLFIAASIAVPIVANGFRALGIVYLGYLLGSAQAAATDHVLYGWIFFSIVILILIALGLPFRQDELPYRKPVSARERLAERLPFQMRRMVLAAIALLLLAGIGPSIAGILSRAATPPPRIALAIDPGPGCTSMPAPSTDPEHPQVRSQRLTCGSFVMDLAWEPFSPRVTAASVMAERRRLCLRAETESLQENWAQPIDGAPSTWRVMQSNDPVFATAVSVWVDGKPVRPGLHMRLRMALNSLFGGSYAPIVATLTPVV